MRLNDLAGRFRFRFRSALLIGSYLSVVVGASFLAERSAKLYGFVVLMLAAGALLAVISRVEAPSWRTVVLVSLLLRLGVFWLPPSLSDDAYRYAWDGRVQAAGKNPYLATPDDDSLSGLRDESVYPNINSTEFFSVYPPLSQMTFAVASVITRSRWPSAYYVIKLITILIELLALLALVRLTDPARAILYAWNPVVVIEVAGQGHTEGLAVGLILVGLLTARRGRGASAGGALSAAGMVKLYPLMFLPPLSRRYGWKCVLASVLAASVMVMPYAATSVPGNIRESLDLYVRYFEFNAGPYYAVKQVLLAVTGQDWSKIIGPVFRWMFVGAVPVIYVLDWKLKWSLEKVAITLLATFFLLSTTIHPWYLVPLMGVLVIESRLRWHWYWLIVVGTGTYLLYVDGPYWLFVNLAWAGWAVLAAAFHFDGALQLVQRVRGRRKWREVRDLIIPGDPSPEDTRAVRILDLGAGEGYVGLAAAQMDGAEVVLADVVDMNRTQLPWKSVEETVLPFTANAFDYTLLYYVLHHAADPEAVVTEAFRVSSRGVVVVESVFRTRGQLKRLCFLDLLANRIRSRGKMTPQEKHLRFRGTDEWRRSFVNLGLQIGEMRTSGGFIHQKAVFRVCK